MAGLTQDDFRRLLATPRPASQQTPRALGAQTPRSNGGKRDAQGFLAPAPIVRPKKKDYKPKRKTDKDKGEDDEAGAGTGAAYRDRAEERRKGVNPDYVETEQMLAVLRATEESQHAGHVVDDMEPATPGVSAAEHQSKYLGGDVTTTHMVKGLDYALLQKVQGDLKRKTDQSTEEQEAVAYVEQLHGNGAVSFDSVMASNIYDTLFKKALIPPPKRNELFFPGRQAFAWDLGEKDPVTGEYVPSPDVPTTMVRSRMDLSEQDRKGSDASNAVVLEKVISVLAFNRTGSRGGPAGGAPEKKRIKRKEKEAAILEAEQRREAAAGAVARKNSEGVKEEPSVEALPEDEDDEEDIFADAGRDYVLEAKERKAKSEVTVKVEVDAKESISKAPYFEPDDVPTTADAMDIDQAVDPATSSEDAITKLVAQSAGMLNLLQGSGAADRIVGKFDSVDSGSLEIGPGDMESQVYANMAAAPRPPSRKRRRADPDTIAEQSAKNDDPSAAAPSHLDDLAALDDSGSDGDEPDLSQMDMGVKQNKRRQLGRFDFDTEEEWFAYKDEQVHLPKAAFQFGVKASDGRQKSGSKRGGSEGKKNGGKKNMDAKLNKEFQQLNKVYSDKYGTGLAGASDKKGKGGTAKKQKK
ncbi:hypothetical protein HKX48_008808 [Thoreauomyces humboldtii]|nr:hypothetical protein HKX48_008808 [Thoreauomyces humboldtii]